MFAIFAWNWNGALSYAAIVCCKRTTITITTNAQHINLQFANNMVFMPRHICLATQPTIRTNSRHCKERERERDRQRGRARKDEHWTHCEQVRKWHNLVCATATVAAYTDATNGEYRHSSHQLQRPTHTHTHTWHKHTPANVFSFFSFVLPLTISFVLSILFFFIDTCIYSFSLIDLRYRTDVVVDVAFSAQCSSYHSFRCLFC